MNLPENYSTCVTFFHIWTLIFKSFAAGFACRGKHNDRPTDEENQQHREKEPQIKVAEGKSKDDGFFPPNYTTCILLFKFAMKVILVVVGIGFGRIKKIKDRKKLYSHASEIMKKMTELESRYKYESTGQRPDQEPEIEHFGGIELPDFAPQADETTSGTTSSTKVQHKNENEKDEIKSVKKDTPILVAAKMGILEMVKQISSTCPVAIQDLDSNGKNVLMLAAENRQTSVFDYLCDANIPEYMLHQLDNNGNSILHHAAMLGELQPWRIPGAALQMQWEIKWYKHVKTSVQPLCIAHHNAAGETPMKIFTRTHEKLVDAGSKWLIKTSESCSLVAALIAAVAFATSATVPGGLNETTGYPVLKGRTAFDIFSIASLMALCLSVSALVFFLTIITSRCEERDFKINLPRKLFIGLTSLLASIAAILLSFCAGHNFILKDNLRFAAVPIYAFASIPVAFFAVAQLPLYFDLLWAACRKVPLRSYKVF